METYLVIGILLALVAFCAILLIQVFPFLKDFQQKSTPAGSKNKRIKEWILKRLRKK